MKIARIELYDVHLPYLGGVYLLSGGREYRGFDAAIVRVLADDGMVPDTALRMLRLLPDGVDFVLEATSATWRETLSLFGGNDEDR